MSSEFIQKVIEMVDKIDYENGPDALMELYPVAEFEAAKAAIEDHYGSEIDTDHCTDEYGSRYGWWVEEYVAVYIKKFNDSSDEFVLDVATACW